jgi:hypothetical protein
MGGTDVFIRRKMALFEMAATVPVLSSYLFQKEEKPL